MHSSWNAIDEILSEYIIRIYRGTLHYKRIHASIAFISDSLFRCPLDNNESTEHPLINFPTPPQNWSLGYGDKHKISFFLILLTLCEYDLTLLPYSSRAPINMKYDRIIGSPCYRLVSIYHWEKFTMWCRNPYMNSKYINVSASSY